MTILMNTAHAVAKSRTLDGLPAIVVECSSPNAAGRPSETQAIAVFADTELGNELADALLDKLNSGKVRL